MTARPQIYIVIHEDRYNRSEIIGNHLDRRQAISFAEKFAIYIGKYNDSEIENIDEMRWKVGNESVYIEIYEINCLNEAVLE